VSWLALLLVGVGLCDLLRAAEARAPIPGGSGALVALVGGLLAGLTRAADIAALVVAAAVVIGWSLVVDRAPRIALLLLAVGLSLAVLLSPYASTADGALGDWLEATRLPVLHGVSADRALLLCGSLLVQLATGNAVVRLVLTLTGSAPLATGRTLKGGRLLGPMERLVILGLGLAGHMTAASLVIAAKGLIRWPELQSFKAAGGPSIDEVTEYFLVGSFVSWLLALSTLVLLAR